MRPSRRAEELSLRGSRQSGIPVDWTYRQHGFQPLVLDASSADGLYAELQRRPVAVVHLNVGLVDYYGTAAVDLMPPRAAKGRPPSAGRLTGAALCALLPPDLPQPLIVLDVPGPTGRREKTTQLLLRNAFAADLAAVGTVRAVLATGLSRYGDQERLYGALIGALGSGCRICEVADRIRDLGREEPLTFPSTALFTRLPGIRFPGPVTS